MHQSHAENQHVAQCLREAADLLEVQRANPYRVAAYRQAAATLAALPRPVREIFDAEGVAGLDALPHIGPRIAGAIAEILITERWNQLDRLRGTVDAVRLFQTIPGVGAGLAARLHDVLGVDTLEALEVACHEGRVDAIPGIGPRRAAALRDSVTAMLDRARRRQRVSTGEEPSVALWLAIDRRYRQEAQAQQLPTITPRRFNPEHVAWLPILHATEDGWHFTALYSNTARAHELDRVFDWVVIYAYQDHSPEIQRTVVTETHGDLEGLRVVRGREAECRDWYRLGPGRK